ncbi:UNVERIFIED_CONTAM: hypothetical protein PYX00_005406 [Menopon gallinae]|uniref:VOC domain-containing protein n=1 Tax=Menopon gallinae TaxID=328185 RepID=A0AAW2HRB2_9NEOP
MALSLQARALHFVFKIGDRPATVKFYKEVLGMRTLRHEEFAEGCEAACNGPYANRWSKTMIGYGPEDTHFVIELTYNYGVKSYDLGNDFLGITIKSHEVIERAKNMKWPMEEKDGKIILKAPGGYIYNIINEPQSSSDPVQKVTLACSNLQKTISYWNGILGMKIIHQQGKSVTLAFNDKHCHLEFVDIGKPVDHAKAYGRIAFAVPKESLPTIQKKIEDTNHKVLTPLISLDTPGKATVTVVILADPDGHEICFVDEEGFRELSQVDENSDKELTRFLNKDKS